MIQRSDIRLLYLHELRSALRERNIVVNSILLPIFLYPLLLWLVYTGISFVVGQTEGFSSRVMLKGLPKEHQRIQHDLKKDKQVELTQSRNSESDIRSGNLDVLVDIVPPVLDAASLTGNFRVRLTYDSSKDRSRIARDRITEHLSRYRDEYFEQEARKLGLTPAQLQRFWVETHNVATGQQMGRFLLGLMVPMMLIVMVAVGSMYPAIDCTAGEREKSTWETLMTVASSRINLVVAKYLYVATMGCVAGVLNLIAMTFSIKSMLGPILGRRVEGMSFQIPWLSLPLIAVVTVLLALFIAAGMMILASFARTFKEGQSMVSPFYLAVLLPVMFLQVPGLELTPVLALIPIVNVCLVFRESIAGVYRWPLIGLTMAVEVVCIVLAMWLAATILRYEDVLIGSYGGHVGRFVKERLIGTKRRTGDSDG